MRAVPRVKMWWSALVIVGRTVKNQMPGSQTSRETRSEMRRISFRRSALNLLSRVPAVAGVTAKIAILALLIVVDATAQTSKTTLDPSSITGFESLGTWSVSALPTPGFTVSISANRTQGNAAYAITNPPSLLRVVSQPIACSAPALAGIGNSGAQLLIDVLIPPQQNNPLNADWIELFIDSKSRDLPRIPVPLIPVNFNPTRRGVYTTLGFTVPRAVSSALNHAACNDLTFELDMILPGRTVGSLLLDNLRVHSVALTQTPTGTPPPPGYGGSVNLIVPGDVPVNQSFTLGPTQIPGAFHLKLGTIGATTVDFKLGLDGSPSTDCTYDQDGTDTTDRSYILSSCTGGFKAGDLINANWLSMTIVNGDDTQKIRAQIAQNPLGDQIGAGLLPPMPTFWGDADTCMPAPQANTVVTVSTSCAAQTAEANQIINSYFNEVKNSDPSPGWIVAPTPEFALRSKDGTPNNNLTGPPPTPSDPPFDDSGDLNPGGSFDAYWRLNGNLNPMNVSGTDDTTTHFDATFGAHGVLFGDDIDVMDVKVTADTDSGEITPTYKEATSTGTLGLYVFGNEVPSGGFSVNPSTGFSVDPTWNQEYDLPPIQIWIFSITLGATANAELKASGSAAVAGVDLSVTPSITLGAHASGGINLGVASGTVDAKVNLVNVSTPTTAQAKWVINTDPQICAATLNGELKSTLNLSSGGGELDLDATFGVCPFCYTDSETLFKWSPLLSENWTLVDDTLDAQLFPLPGTLCTFPISTTISSPASGANLNAGVPISLLGSAVPVGFSLPTTAVYNWTFTPANSSDTYTVDPATANTASPLVTFGTPTAGVSTWTVGMNATVSTRSASGSQIMVNGTATPVTFTVSNLTPGVYITDFVGTSNGSPLTTPANNGSVSLYNPGSQTTINGLVSGATGTLNTTFTVAQCVDGTAACTQPCTDANACYLQTLTPVDPTSPTPSVVWNFPGFATYYKVTMTTTQDGSPYGTPAQVLVFVTVLL